MSMRWVNMVSSNVHCAYQNRTELVFLMYTRCYLCTVMVKSNWKGAKIDLKKGQEFIKKCVIRKANCMQYKVVQDR